MSKLTGLLVGASALLAVSSSYATPISYGEATHRTTAWQELATYENGVEVDQFGVSWSTDNGTTWGRDNLVVGQEVQFKFNVHKKNVGTHQSDLLKAWIDWGQDGEFDAADEIAYTMRSLLPVEDGNLGSWNTPNVEDFVVFSDSFVLGKEHVGETWLRSRVTCSHSLVLEAGGVWNDQWSPEYIEGYHDQFGPNGYYYQGEAEDWKLVVSDVPEPSALIMLGLSLSGLIAVRRRKVRAA